MTVEGMLITLVFAIAGSLLGSFLTNKVMMSIVNRKNKKDGL